MIRHIILWQLKDELTDSEKESLKWEIKERLEALAGQVPGLAAIKVYIDPMESSNADIFLDSAVEDEKALDIYQNFPAHVYVKENLLGPNAKIRLCIDVRD